MPPSIIKMAGEAPPKMAFDTEKHLNFKEPSKIWTMDEIGMNDRGVSPVAVSEPFSLFTPEAIHQMRAEVLSKGVINNCLYSCELNDTMLRGFAAE